MITKFKLFESVTMKPKSAWIVYGVKENVIDILQRIKKQLYYSDIISKTDTIRSIGVTISRIERVKTDKDSDDGNGTWPVSYIGFMIYYSNYGFSYSIIYDELLLH